MAKTIQEAGGQVDGGVTQTSTALTGQAKITPQKAQVGDSLAKDILGITKPGAELTQAGYTASIKAAERVANDNLVSLETQIAINEGNTNYNSIESMENTKELNNKAFVRYGGKSFDNDDADAAYKKNYSQTGALGVVRTNKVLNIKSLALQDVRLQEEVSLKFEVRAAGSSLVQPTTLKSSVEQITASGRNNKEDAQLVFAKRSVTGFNTRIEGDLEGELIEASYDFKKRDYSSNVKAYMFNRNFIAYAEMDTKTGEIVWRDTIEDKAKREILSSWKAFDKTMTSLSDSKEPNYPYQDFKINTSEVVQTAQEGKFTSKQLKDNIKKLTKEANALKSFKSQALTKSQLEHIYSEGRKLTIEQLKVDAVEGALKLNKQQLATALKTGVEWEFEGKTFKVDKPYIQNVINAKQEEYSDVINSSEVGSEEYINGINSAIALTYKTGIANPVVNSLTASLTGDNMFQSASEINKATDASGRVRTQGTSNALLKNLIFQSTMANMKARYEKGEWKTEGEYVEAVNAKMVNVKQAVYARIDNGEFRKNWTNAIKESKDRWFHNVNVTSKTVDAMMFLYVASGGTEFNNEEAMEKFIKNNSVTFVGGATVFANTWGDKLPFLGETATAAIMLKNKDGENLKSEVYDDAIDNIVIEYNAKNPNNKITESDIRVSSTYKGGKNENEAGWVIGIWENDRIITIKTMNGQQLTEASLDTYLSDEVKFNDAKDSALSTVSKLGRGTTVGALADIADWVINRQNSEEPKETANTKAVMDNAKDTVVGTAKAVVGATGPGAVVGVVKELFAIYQNDPSSLPNKIREFFDNSKDKKEVTPESIAQAIDDNTSVPKPDKKQSILLKDRQQNFSVQNSGTTKVTSTFDSMMMQIENNKSVGGGWNRYTKKWKPHKSFEGGANTLAYGHKLTSTELSTRKVEIDNVFYDIDNLSDGQAKALYKQDMSNASKAAAKSIGKENWAKMSEVNQKLAAELQFNVRGGVKNFTEFITAATDPDTEDDAYKLINRTATTSDGKVRSLTERTDKLKDWAKENNA